jgi:hypothetical protein
MRDAMSEQMSSMPVPMTIVLAIVAPLWVLILFVPALLLMTINVTLGGGFNDTPNQWHDRIRQLWR